MLETLNIPTGWRVAADGSEERVFRPNLERGMSYDEITAALGLTVEEMNGLKSLWVAVRTCFAENPALAKALNEYLLAQQAEPEEL